MRRASPSSAYDRIKGFSRGFTMLELIFVIVVMGIIGKIGAEVLGVMYNNYLSTAVNNRMQADTELTLQQIANRMQYRIRDSVIVANGGAYTGLSSAVAGTNYTEFEWIGYDIDGWMGTFRNGFNHPTWTGFIDVDNILAGATILSTPQTDNDLVDDVIEDVRANGSATGIGNSAIFFTGANTDVSNDYGWYSGAPIITQNGTAAHRIADGGFGQFISGNAADFAGVAVYEQYKLAWTAYALHLANDNTLWLYYDYQPWEGETALANGRPVRLLENVSTMKAQGIGDVIKLQICVDNNTTGNTNAAEIYSLCKEKVIF